MIMYESEGVMDGRLTGIRAIFHPKDHTLLPIPFPSDWPYSPLVSFQKYLLPHLQPPNASALETDHDSLTAKYDEVAAQLAALDQETKAVRLGIDQQKEIVENSIKEVEVAVREMRDGDKLREEEMRKVKEEVEGIRESLPKVSH